MRYYGIIYYIIYIVWYAQKLHMNVISRVGFLQLSFDFWISLLTVVLIFLWILPQCLSMRPWWISPGSSSTNVSELKNNMRIYRQSLLYLIGLFWLFCFVSCYLHIHVNFLNISSQNSQPEWSWFLNAIELHVLSELTDNKFCCQSILTTKLFDPSCTHRKRDILMVSKFHDCQLDWTRGVFSHPWVSRFRGWHP